MVAAVCPDPGLIRLRKAPVAKGTTLDRSVVALVPATGADVSGIVVDICRCWVLARRRRSKKSRRRRIIARPATPPTTPPTTAGVEGAPVSLEPAPEVAVDEGANPVPLIPLEPPMPPPMTAPVLDGLNDEDSILEVEEVEDCVCEVVALPEMDEASEIVRRAEVIDGVEEAPLVWSELDLVDVTMVLFSLVVTVFKFRALVPVKVVLESANKE